MSPHESHTPFPSLKTTVDFEAPKASVRLAFLFFFFFELTLNIA